MKQNTSVITRIVRIGYLLTFILIGLIVAVCVFPLIGAERKNALIRWWSQHIMAGLNISVIVSGQVPGVQQKHVLFVANHVSWVEIFAINSVFPMRFIAKSEIRNWPAIGFLAKQANTLFIQREKRRHASQMTKSIAESLQQGDNLCLFPEGTTTNGHQVHPFKASLFQAAIDAKTVVWPIAIRYPDENGNKETAMAYADDTSLVDSIKTILSMHNPKVELHFLTPIGAQESQNRQQLAALSRESILKVLE